MAGKRILDAVALFNASRSVAAKHIDIRLSQIDLYRRTSSLVRLARVQAESNTSPLVQRFSQVSASKASAPRSTNIPTSKSTAESRPPRGRDEGVQQDHFYDKSQQHSTADAAPQTDLEIQQSKSSRQPFPDGTIPPKDSPIGQDSGDPESYSRRPTTEQHEKSVLESKEDSQSQLENRSSTQSGMPFPASRTVDLSSEDARILQRQSESQIPARPAEPPTGEASGLKTAADRPEFAVEQEQDIFYQPPGTTSPVLSALPRVRVPKVEWDVQGGDPHVPEGINADVYYSGEESVSSGSTTENPSDEIFTQIFHSPRVARLLSNKGKLGAGPGAARAFHSNCVCRQNPVDAEQESLRKLGADVAEDAQRSSAIRVKASSTPQTYQMRESRVPSSRVGRLFEYGGLAASMAFGAVSESISRSNGPGGSLMLSPANMERLVAKLSKMRGAALKLGQMMSFQDSNLLPKPVHDVLQRVQDSADYMPVSQRDSVIASDLGPDWRNLFESFDEKPMAAASIGQVHGAVLKSGQSVAVKVQYPGVATSISSDLNNLNLLLTASRLLPKGLYLDKTIANARTELAWECDYIREANCARRFRNLLADDADIFTVPAIIDEASGKQVLTMEMMEGTAVTKVQNFTQDQRDWIGTQILRLCLREIVEFKYMQTDPNWTNFLYNDKTKKVELLDFGASREFSDKFIALYVKNLEAASLKDKDGVRDHSIALGYLTGYESKAMLNAHIESVMTLAEPFMDFAPDVYDFRDQTITDRVRGLIPVMVKERLAPPPEETYSLHRKLSGAFLLCARLGSRVKCKELFQQAIAKAHFA